MTAEQLKASVISFAISGDLTAEWRELYGRSLEKWKYSPLSKICHSMRYGTAKKSLDFGKVVVLRMGNLQNGEIDWTSLVYTNDTEDIEKYSLTEGDILFNRTNSPELVGKTSIYRGKYPAIFAGYLIKLDYDRNVICGEYLNFVMNSQEERDFCALVKTNGVCQANINAKKIGEFVIPIPPLDEQKEIVARLEELLPLVEEYGNAHAALKKTEEALPDQLRASLLQEAIQGKLVPQIDDEPAVDVAGEAPEDVPFAIPEKWKWVTLTDIVKVIPSKNYQIQAKQVLPEGELPVVSQSKNYIDGYSNEQNKLLSKDYLPIILFGDHTRVVKFIDFQFVVGADGTKLLHPKDNVEGKFLYYLLQYNVLGMRNRGYSRYFQFLKAIHIPLPPLAEQRRIVARLEELLPHVDAIAGVR